MPQRMVITVAKGPQKGKNLFEHCFNSFLDGKSWK